LKILDNGKIDVIAVGLGKASLVEVDKLDFLNFKVVNTVEFGLENTNNF